MKQIVTLSICFVFLCVTQQTVTADAQESYLVLKTAAFIEKEIFNEEGKKQLKEVPVSKVVPGNQVLFTISYVNQGEKPISKAVITNPVPEHMTYQAGTAEGGGTDIFYSVDNGSSWEKPEDLFIRLSDGKKRQATPEEYTHIRWEFKKSLSSKASGAVRFKAVLR